MKHCLPLVLVLLCAVGAGPATRSVGTPPNVGEKVPDFALDTLDGTPVRLSDLLTVGPVVVVELRGWVGYQCPICTKQVADLIANADAFKKSNATVVLVYPGPTDGLKGHAEDFAAGKAMPDNFRFVTDPGLTFVNAWGLRWIKPGETAYPSTFVVDTTGNVQFAKVSHTHGGRATAKQILTALGTRP